MSNAILLISCQDAKGITANVTNFIFENNGNIENADQHIDEQSQTFFMRIEWSLSGFAFDQKEISANFAPIAEKFNMQWELYFSDQKPRIVIFVSKHLHCLYDLLTRKKTGRLDCDIPLIISNHPDAEDVAKGFDVTFKLFPKTPDNKATQEQEEIKSVKEVNADLIVLARYHQILGPDFIKEFENKIINIHHSFLPAFPGGNPYAKAYAKGVKIIGATSHFVTEELDQGPIIEQDTVRISHRDFLDDLKRKGEDLEKLVLHRALRLALERKILCYDNKTVIFD